MRIAIGFTAWAERWFPDAFVFVAIAVVVVAVASLANGASPAYAAWRLGTVLELDHVHHADGLRGHERYVVATSRRRAG